MNTPIMVAMRTVGMIQPSCSNWPAIKVLSPLDTTEATQLLIEKLEKTKTNTDFLDLMQKM
jgi:transcription termination factor Rho